MGVGVGVGVGVGGRGGNQAEGNSNAPPPLYTSLTNITKNSYASCNTPYSIILPLSPTSIFRLSINCYTIELIEINEV